MISLLVVNYRSAAIAAEAIRSARASCSMPLQVVVVDNSCEAAEADHLKPHADCVIASPVNRGYAGAINDGRRACDGEVLIVSNPDVIFGEQAIDVLAAALERVAVAGPALFWDTRSEWHLPPAELHTGGEVLSAGAASRLPSWRAARDRQRIRKRLAFWSLVAPTAVRAISGAVMAIRASAFDAVGGFDERFRLYFEENDFVRRLQQQRHAIAYVPAAKCRHLYNQSAGQSGAYASDAYAESEQKYLAKWSGPWAARMLKRIEKPVPAGADPQPLRGPIELGRPDEVVIEASPLASFETAAGHFPATGRVELPLEVWDAYRADVVYLRVVERATARVLATFARYKS